MKCIYCNCTESRVVDSRPTEDGSQHPPPPGVRRIASARFTTYEKIEMLPVHGGQKRIKRRETVRRRPKLRTGIVKACEKRPVPLVRD